MSNFTNYTFTFDAGEERQFRAVLSRLDPSEYNMVEDVSLITPDEPRTSDRHAVIEMEPESCLTFRLGMKHVKIRRARTEEELAEEKELNDRNKITIRVQVPTDPNANTP